MNAFVVSVSIINKFCNNFKDLFSKRQFSIFRAFTYALINEYKRLNLSSVAKTLGVDYEKVQYFLSDSQWNYQQLNDKRINLLRSQRTTGFSKNGLLIIDDTGVLKPYAANTEGAQYQHCPVLGKEAVCNVAVASCLGVNNRYIPLDVKFYKTQDEFLLGKQDPEFRSKLDLAKELITEACAKQLPFNYVVFDSWYSASDVLNFIQEKDLKFISEVKSDRKLYFRNPQLKRSYFMQQDELVRLIRKHLWHKVRVFRHRGEEMYVYSFKSRLKRTLFPVSVFVVMGRLSYKDNRDVRMIISNDLGLSYKEALPTYFQRWAIERLFRELKDSLYFDHYQLRHKLKIMRYWMMVILVWTLLYWIRQNGYLYRSISSSLKGKSINECKQALLKLIIFSSYEVLRKNNLTYIKKKHKRRF
jgi:SRSO17 transposase